MSRLLCGALVIVAAACSEPAPEPRGPQTPATATEARAGNQAQRGLQPSDTAIPAETAWRLIDLGDGTTIGEARPDILDTPIQPGSLMKIVTLAAAVEAGLVTDRTALLCPRRLRVGDHVLDCAHPDLGRPMTARDALAYSCNNFFAEIGRRIARPQLSRAAMALGLPALAEGRDPVLTALGLDSYRVAPRLWPTVMRHLVASDEPHGLDASTRAILRDGLRDSVRTGTAAAAFEEPGVLAKTGTASMPGGGVVGIAAVALTDRPQPSALVVVAPGAAGRDAVSIAADILRHDHEHRDPAFSSLAAQEPVRVGIARAKGGYDVRDMPLEDYVSGVLTAEVPANVPAATLEAMAVVARTFVTRHRGRHTADGFDVCDLTHCQVLGRPTPQARRAAGVTAGQIVSWHGAAADVFYSASCGGMLASASDVWRSGDAFDEPFLQARRDPASPAVREVEWEADIDASRLLEILRAAGLTGDRVDDLIVAERSATGRAQTLRAVGMVPDTIGGEHFRLATGRVAGWQLVKSTWFDVARTAHGFHLSGRGHGHGVGLCVRGAVAMGTNHTAAGILAAYFPGAAIASVTDLATASAAETLRFDARLVLPAADEAARAGLWRDLQQVARTLTARLEEPPPQDVTIRFHPSVGSYQRSTGRAWWTSATTRASRIDLLPIAVLRDHRRVETTLAHELTHVMTARRLGGRPLWVIEGVAAYFAAGDADAGASATPGPCPDDAAFDAASSGTELAGLYDRAAACVAHRLKGGRDWRDLP
jgi:stage II sporulation protein D